MNPTLIFPILITPIFFFLFPITGSTQNVPDNRFEDLGAIKGRGSVLARIVGPGPEVGMERVYLSYIYQAYQNRRLEIVSIDPASGNYDVFPAPAEGEEGAWGLIAGPDGNIYVGTLPGAHIFQLNPQKKTFVDLGRPSETEEYIWEFALGKDGTIYGCTYPSSKLVSYNPYTKKLADLGRCDETELYARRIASDTDGIIYIGIGPAKMNIVSYDPATGKKKSILPDKYRTSGFAIVYRGLDGKAYGQVGKQHFLLNRDTCIEIPTSQFPGTAPLALKDGRIVQVTDNQLVLTDPKTNEVTTYPYTYPGSDVRIFRIQLGPDGKIYGSTILPLHFFKCDPQGRKVSHIGMTRSGAEVYSMQSYGSKLYMASYPQAELRIYDPQKPWADSLKKDKGNPLYLGPLGDAQDRPVAMILGHNKKIYIGSIPTYGELGGALTELDPETNTWQNYRNVVKNQSIWSLAETPDGLICGATSIFGGGGSHPTEKEGHLFLWDPKSKSVVYDGVPVPNTKTVAAIAASKSGIIVGATSDSNMIFLFDPQERLIMKTIPLEFGKVVWNCMGAGPHGLVYGVTEQGVVFSVEPRSGTITQLAKYPKEISAGLVIDGNYIYFGSGSHVVRYRVK